MKQMLKALIKDFEEWEIPNPIERNIDFPEFPSHVRKAYVLMGVRRGGKTWILYQKMHKLLQTGFDKRKILYINFEDDRLNTFSSKDFQSILDAYFDLYPEFTKSNDLAFFFDEIHLIEGWEKFIRRLLDQEKMQLYVTGSSAAMLSSEIATTLRGRAWPQEVFPFSFAEFVAYKEPALSNNTSTKNASKLRKLASDYLCFGGFPESIFISNEHHSTLLQEYMNTMLFRDVVERHSVSSAHIVKLFFLQVLRQLAAPLSVNKVFNRMKSQGLEVGKNSLYEYLGYFEEAYGLFCIPIYSFSEHTQQVNPKKIYAVDPGIITAYTIKDDFERASRLENAVFCKLRQTSKEIFYYRSQKQLEVDFVLLTSTGELILYQVCHDLSHPDTRLREVQAIQAACKELGLNGGFIITEDHEEIIEQEQVIIQCIPFWKWAK